MSYHLGNLGFLFDAGVNYRPWVTQLPAYAEANLNQYLAEAGVRSVTISSTLRTPADQARIMLDAYNRRGPAYLLDLYDDRQPVSLIEGLRSTGASDPAIRDALTTYISAYPSRVSHHIATGDPNQAVCDIEPSTVDGDYNALVAALERAKSRGELSRLIVPPKDEAIHLEFVAGKVAQVAQAAVNVLTPGGDSEGAAFVAGVPVWGYVVGAAAVAVVWYFRRRG